MGISLKISRIDPSCLLTIVIPTRNRAQELRGVISKIISYVEDLSTKEIQIVISNNGGDKRTKQVVKTFKENNLLKNLIYIETPSSFETAEEHLCWLYKIKFGNYVWFLGDQDIPNKKGFFSAISTLRAQHSKYSFFLFNFSTMRKGKLISPSYLGPDFKIDEQLNFSQAVQEFGYWAGICGISNQILKSSLLSSNILKSIISECGPIYSHMTHHLHQYGDKAGLMVSEPLVRYALNDLSDGNDSSWRNYAVKVNKPYFDPWLLGFMRQIDFLFARNIIEKDFLFRVIDYEVGLKDFPEVIPLSTRIRFSFESYLYHLGINNEKSYSKQNEKELARLLKKFLPEMQNVWQKLQIRSRKNIIPRHYVWGAFSQYFLTEYKRFCIYKIGDEFVAVFKPKRELLRFALRNSKFLCEHHFYRAENYDDLCHRIDAVKFSLRCNCKKDEFLSTAYLRVPHWLLILLAKPYYKLPLKIRTLIRKYLG